MVKDGYLIDDGKGNYRWTDKVPPEVAARMRRESELAKVHADNVIRAIERVEIEERCKASGCVRGEFNGHAAPAGPCRHTGKFGLCAEYLRYYGEKESRDVAGLM